MVYDGTQKAATLNDDYNRELFPNVSVAYLTEDGTTLNAAPVNAGSYTARVTAPDETSASVTYTVSKREVTVSGITAADKSYDGSTDAQLNYDNVTFDGKLASDTLTVNATGTFESAEAGQRTVRISNLTLGGADADNYQLAASGQQSETTVTITPPHTVIWLNGDGSQLDSKTYTDGETEPTTDKTPVKAADADNTYTFSGWDNGVTQGDVKTYTPEFAATPKTVYTVIWRNGDGTELDRKTYKDGEPEPTTDRTPVKAADADNTYVFTNWDNGVTEGNVKTYTPEFTATANTVYTVIWLNGDGSQLDSKTYKYGEPEPETHKRPSKAADEENVYTFTNWDEGVTEGNVKTYTPEFFAITNMVEPQPIVAEVNSSVEVGQAEIASNVLTSLNISEEKKQALISALESTGLSAKTEREQALQTAALSNAVDNIPAAEQQIENQLALNTMLQMSGLSLTEDGELPQGVTFDIKREVFTKIEATGYNEQTLAGGIVQKSLSLNIDALYNTVASLTNELDPDMNMSGIAVGEAKPTVVNKPISLSVSLPEDFTEDNFVFVNHTHNLKNYTYRGELGAPENGQRPMSFMSLGLSPFEIVSAQDMAATLSVEADGVNVDLYYATLQEAVAEVENNGVITLMEPVKAALASEQGKGYTLRLGEGLNADDVELTVDGKSVTFQDGKATILAASENSGGDATSGGAKGGCYVATSVYGSYDCPEVWTLRRFRDEVLAETWYGRLFIKLYYTVSPTAVKLFGDCEWFRNFFRDRLDKMVAGLQEDGFESTPYEDRAW